MITVNIKIAVMQVVGGIFFAIEVIGVQIHGAIKVKEKYQNVGILKKYGVDLEVGMIEWENINNWCTVDDGQEILAYTRKYSYVIGAKDGDFVVNNSSDITLYEEITHFVILNPPEN